MFSEKEITYLQNQPLARIATVSEALQPDVAPVGFDFDGTYFYVGGLAMSRTLKHKNVQANSKMSLVIDDMESMDPWMPRGIKMHGIADLVSYTGYMGEGTYIRIIPTAKWSWGIEAPTFPEGQPQSSTGTQE